MKEYQTCLPFFASFITDVNFAYWPILQLLLSPNAYLKDGVVSFTLNPVLVIAMIEIIQYCTAVSKKEIKHNKNAKYIMHSTVYFSSFCESRQSGRGSIVPMSAQGRRGADLILPLYRLTATTYSR